MFGFIRKNYVVIDASVEDHKAIARLHGDSFQRGWSKSEIDKLAESAGTTLLIARQVGARSGNIAGFNIIRSAANEAEILSIAVDAKKRRSGIADRLMREAIIRLRADRTEALLLEVAENNMAAINLYKHFGFEIVGNRPGYYTPVEQTDEPVGEKQRAMALVMRLDLV